MSQKKKILITGVTGGIGKAIVNELLSEELLLVGKDTDALSALVTELPTDTKIATYAVDFSDRNALVTMCDKIVQEYTSIDWVIHVAGYISKEDSFTTTAYDEIENIFSINLFAPFIITTKLYDQISSDGGSILVSSTAGVHGNGRVPAYAVSKGAVNTLSKSLALSWQDGERRSIAICPGPTNTAMREKLAGDAATHQSPEVVSSCIKDVIVRPDVYLNGSVYTVNQGKVDIVS